MPAALLADFRRVTAPLLATLAPQAVAPAALAALATLGAVRRCAGPPRDLDRGRRRGDAERPANGGAPLPAATSRLRRRYVDAQDCELARRDAAAVHTLPTSRD